MRQYLLAIVLNTIILSSCYANEAGIKHVKGLYVNYEGAEYERTFIPCNTDGAWWVDGGVAFNELTSLYRSSTLSKYGELYVELEGKFIPIDKAKYPDSHYSGDFQIVKLVGSSTDSKIIDTCRGK